MRKALCLIVLAGLFFATTLNSARADQNAAKLTVLHITRGEDAVLSEKDVTFQTLKSGLVRGVRVGMEIPDNDGVLIEVPVNVTVVVAAGRSTATLLPLSRDTFSRRGASESVTIEAGTTKFDDPLDFYTVNGGPVAALHHTTVFSFALTSENATIACSEGFVDTTRVGSTGPDKLAVTYIKQVNRVVAGSSVRYALGRESAADVESLLNANRLASKEGDANAQVNLGAMYLNGTGVARDYSLAAHYFLLAAAQRNAAAENNLGLMYARGQGVSQDYQAALHYFDLAAAHSTTYGGTLFVEKIMRYHQAVTDDPDVTVLAPDGQGLKRGVNTGEAIPHDSRVSVAADVTLFLAWGSTRIELFPESEVTFRWSNAGASATLNRGKIGVRGPLDFFRVILPGAAIKAIYRD